MFLITPVLRAALYALKIENGVLGSLPLFADQLAAGCLLAIVQPRLLEIGGRWALLMFFAAVLIPWYPATSPIRTLFMLFVLRPLLHLSLAGLVLRVIQVPYRALNIAPVAWLGRVSYSLYLWQELFCSNQALHWGYLLAIPALACACLSYYLVEQRMLRARDACSAGRKSRPQSVALEAGNSSASEVAAGG